MTIKFSIIIKILVAKKLKNFKEFYNFSNKYNFIFFQINRALFKKCFQKQFLKTIL